jgi:phosphoenolpyruvate-protein kinase (PTS system EI component)
MKCVEARDALARSVQAVGGAKAPELGAMIETAGSLEQLAEIAAEADFLSIGTNDLTAAVLAADRFGPGRLAATFKGPGGDRGHRRCRRGGSRPARGLR